jgi:hypothetical protein
MNELPGMPPPDEEWNLPAAQELRLEQARLLAEENEPKIWKLPLEGALYWAKKNQLPAGSWLHGIMVRNRRLWVVFELLLWGAGLGVMLRLTPRLFHERPIMMRFPLGHF